MKARGFILNLGPDFPRSRDRDWRPIPAAGAWRVACTSTWQTKGVIAGSPTTEVEESEMAQTIVTSSRPAYQAYQILYIGFIVAPFLAGLDKFTHFLTNWDQYLAPAVERMLPVSGHTFMLFVGIVEMAAAVLVAVRPRIGAYVVVAWLLGIIVNLLLIPGYFDVALRDFGLALGALALARLSEEFAEPSVRD